MARTAKAKPLLAYVIALAAAMTIPPLVLALLTTHRWVGAERARLETVTHETARRAMAQVDRFLVGKIAMLQALATSPAIDGGDFERIDRQARELLDLQGLNVVMRDLDGQQIVNTRVPWGTPLPRVASFEADREVVARRAPVVADLYAGNMAAGPLVRVIVPVIRDDAVRYTLTASLSPAALGGMLIEGGLVAPYMGSIADRTGHILSRSPYRPETVGRSLPGFAGLTGPSGSWMGVNPQGIEVYGAYQRSPLSGWTYAVGVDKRLLDGPLYASVLWLAGFALMLGGIAITASAFIARRIVSAHRRLEVAAEALGLGETVEAPATRLRETDRIGTALVAASARLRQSSDDLHAANRLLERRVAERTRELSEQSALMQATLENMDQGLMMIGPDGHVPICNGRAIELLDLPTELMTSHPAFEAVLRHQIAHGEFENADEVMRTFVLSGGVARTNHRYERERPNGTVLEIRSVPLASGGAVRTFTDVTARKSAERLSHHMARHDGLTGLPNRTLFRERLTEVLASGRTAAVLCLDLDRFKAVNDSFGHSEGDALLRALGARLGALLDGNDLVARLGGDEFVVVQTGGTQPNAAIALAQRIIEEVCHPVDLGGQTVHVGTSLGIALAPVDGEDADTLFRSADLALYRAKAQGGNTFRFYEPTMDAAVQARRSLEDDLRRALQRREFSLHYQPIIRLATGEVTAFEALLRWTGPDGIGVPPAAFIPVAEDSRLIVPIGSWVLREACREAAGWPGSVRVMVNISAVQVEDPGLVAGVLSALAGSGLSPSRLQLEITETVLMHECAAVRDTLRTLRDLGICIALDDFGTGHASLSYLRNLPLDCLKIDRSFVQNEADATSGAIYEAIVGLGQSLGIAVTAEGVETIDQLERARRLGCDEAQGFLLSRPLPAAAARAFLSAQTTSVSAAA